MIQLPGASAALHALAQREVFGPALAGPSAGHVVVYGLEIALLVATVVAMVADGMTNDEILREHPDLELGDISEALHYAALAVQERELPLRLPA